MSHYLTAEIFTIANGATDSNVLRLEQTLYLVALDMPAAFTGTSVKVLCSSDPVFNNMDTPGLPVTPLVANMKLAYESDTGADTSIAVSAGKMVQVRDAIATNWIALRSSAAEGGVRTITALFRSVD